MAGEPDFSVTVREIPVDDIESARAQRALTMMASARRQIADHVGANVNIEQGGVLVGEVDEGSGTVRVMAAIPSHRAEGSAASLTFTHDAWDEVNDVLAESYPDLRMVGWYHSHPDFGIFLSAYDKFIQENFFSATWQLAYVVDPVRRQSGFFGWERGAVVSIPQWKELTPQGRSTTQHNSHGVAAPRRAGSAPSVGWGNAIRAGFFALIIGLVGGYFIGKAADSPASPPPPTSGSLAVVNAGSDISVARSWTRADDKIALAVTVVNGSHSTQAGSISNCAPSVTASGRIEATACSFVGSPLKAHGGRTFLFSIHDPNAGANPWSHLGPPTFVPKRR